MTCMGTGSSSQHNRASAGPECGGLHEGYARKFWNWPVMCRTMDVASARKFWCWPVICRIMDAEIIVVPYQFWLLASGCGCLWLYIDFYPRDFWMNQSAHAKPSLFASSQLFFQFVSTIIYTPWRVRSRHNHGASMGNSPWPLEGALDSPRQDLRWSSYGHEAST